MAIPTHDISCITKSYLTTCPACRAEVWYFSCSCGSKLFFVSLGYPWEIHVCRQYALEQEVLMLKKSERLSDDEIYSIIGKLEKQKGHIVDDNTLEILQGILGKRHLPFSAFRVEADSSSEFAGQVMEYNNPVNIFKKLGYDASNAMSVKLLGKAAQNAWAIMTVRTKPDQQNRAAEYEIFVPLESFRRQSIRKGNFVSGILDVYQHPKGKFWMLRKVRVL